MSFRKISNALLKTEPNNPSSNLLSWLGRCSVWCAHTFFLKIYSVIIFFWPWKQSYENSAISQDDNNYACTSNIFWCYHWNHKTIRSCCPWIHGFFRDFSFCQTAQLKFSQENTKLLDSFAWIQVFLYILRWICLVRVGNLRLVFLF